MTDQELQIFNAPGIIKKEDLDVRFGGAPVRPQITSPDNRSSSDRRYLRRMAEWNSTREREIADEERARTYQRQDVADEMNQKKLMLDEANSKIQQEEYRSKQELQAQIKTDTLGGLPILTKLDPRSEDFLVQQAQVYADYPRLALSAEAKAISGLHNEVFNTWSSNKKTVDAHNEAKQEKLQKYHAELAGKLGEFGVPVQDYYDRKDGELVPKKSIAEIEYAAGAGKFARESGKEQDRLNYNTNQALANKTVELAGLEAAINAAEKDPKAAPTKNPDGSWNEPLKYDDQFKIYRDNKNKVEQIRGEVEKIKQSASPQPTTTQPKGEDKFIVGNVYKDASGNSATYLGNGKWK